MIVVVIMRIEQWNVFDKDTGATFRCADVEDGKTKVSFHLFPNGNLKTNAIRPSHFSVIDADLSPFSITNFNTEFHSGHDHRKN